MKLTRKNKMKNILKVYADLMYEYNNSAFEVVMACITSGIAMSQDYVICHDRFSLAGIINAVSVLEAIEEDDEFLLAMTVGSTVMTIRNDIIPSVEGMYEHEPPCEVGLLTIIDIKTKTSHQYHQVLEKLATQMSDLL